MTTHGLARPPRPRHTSIGFAVLAASLSWLGSGCAGEPAEIRNVVLVSLDTLGAKHVGGYGAARDTTPNLDQLAAEGTSFDAAYAQQVITLTSHLSMLTGLYPQVHGASRVQPVRPGATTLAEVLQSQGFTTAAFTGTGGYMKPGTGMGRGFELYRVGKMEINDDAERFDWLEEQARRLERDPSHRFFLFSHYYDVHSDRDTEVPYDAPLPYRERFFPHGFEWHRSGDTSLLVELDRDGSATAKDIDVLNGLYDAGVRYTDETRLGGLIEKLRELDLYEDTLIVVTSDHGEEFLEHGRLSHQQPYRETARVPFVLRGPGVPEALRVPDIVELVDLMPTVLALLEIKAPREVQGRDLGPLLRGEAAPSRPAHVDGIFGGVPNHWRVAPSSIVRELEGERWSYVNTVGLAQKAKGRVFQTKREDELYRLGTDPEQKENLAERRPDITAALKAELLDWYTANDRKGQRLGQSDMAPGLLSPQERAELKALGYVE